MKKWLQVKESRSVQHSNPVIRDLESRMPQRHQYRSKDLINWAHETTHGLNSKIRGSLGPELRAFYVLKGRCWICSDCDFKMGRVGAIVPRLVRGNVYHYLKAPDWQDRPSYLLDEWVAYLNGTEAGLLGQKDDWRPESLEFAFEVGMYCCYLGSLNQEYLDFIRMQFERNCLLFLKMRDRGWRDHDVEKRIRIGKQDFFLELLEKLFGPNWVRKYWNE